MKQFLCLLALLTLFNLASKAQKIATWKGGQAGRPSDWYCPSNWKEGRVPNEFSAVYIPDVSTSSCSYPIILEGVVEVSSFECAPSAHLILRGNARIIELDAPDRKPPSLKEAFAHSPADSMPTHRQ